MNLNNIFKSCRILKLYQFIQSIYTVNTLQLTFNKRQHHGHEMQRNVSLEWIGFVSLTDEGFQ